DVYAVGGDFLNVFGVAGRPRAKDYDLRPRALHVLAVIGELSLRRDREILRHRLHSRRVLITDPHDFRLRVLVNETQQVSHVHVIEIDAGDPPVSGTHRSSLSETQGMTQGSID